MTHEYSNKLAFITGGSSGIGLALAKQFSRRGANVWIAARHKEQLIAAQAEIEAARKNPSQKVGILQLDVADREQIKLVCDQLVMEAGSPDYLVNCAGVVHPGEFLRLDMQRFQWMMDINYFGTVYVTRALLPGMVARGSGHIVNISSSAGYIGVYGYTAYCASKYAVRGFSDALRSEIKHCGIDLSLVFPPDTDTPQLAYEKPFKPPITRELSQTAGLMSPDAVAKAILQGVERKKYIIAPGFMNHLIYAVVNTLGAGWYPVMDWLVRDARKKVGNEKDQACECAPIEQNKDENPQAR
jgi:3-dehydrosphinganine reductase